jgi:hypothetical protein
MQTSQGQPSSTSVRHRVLRAGALSVSVVALVGPLALSGVSAQAAAAAGPGPTAPGIHRVATVSYDLGDDAFQDPAYESPVELAAVVHYPRDLGAGGPRPLVVQLHGSWWTCADREAEAALKAAEEAGDEEAAGLAAQALGGWPCASGVTPLPSERGYDYLGENLASHGFVVVSIRANGINAGSLVNAYPARAHLINKHLAMWQRLSATGKGRLAGKFTDPATGRPRQVDFQGRVDLTNVGTMGHSRGGKAVMWQAADKYRNEWPTGVKIKAVLPLAPVHFNINDGDPSDGLVTRVPFAALTGTCDRGGGRRGANYFTDASGTNKTPIHAFTLHGANHNFFNTQWSPDSGQVMTEDDATPYGDPQSGQCHDSATDSGDRKLSEAQQREAGLAYISAFFRRYLNGEKRFDPMLTGKTHPMSHVTKVDVDADLPATRPAPTP